MTPLQADMLANTLAMIAGVISVETLLTDDDDPLRFQETIAKQCRKAFRTQLNSLHIVTPEPRPKQRPPSAQPPKPKKEPHP